MRLEQVQLAAPRAALEDLRRFYGEELGLAARLQPGRSLTVELRHSRLIFGAEDGEPFHHFAILVPGDRFAAAQAWLGDRAPLLSRAGGSTRFDFAFWDAEACYVHDPAGNIVELIAHHGLCERSAGGSPFAPTELLEVSEVGMVSEDGPALARALAGVGVVVWDGSPEDGGLAFAGEKARTVIIAPTGRGWLPTGRPAEMHRVAVTVRGLPAAEVSVPGTPHRLTTIP